MREKYVRMHEIFISQLQMYPNAMSSFEGLFANFYFAPNEIARHSRQSQKRPFKISNPDYDVVIKRLHFVLWI